MARRCIVCGEEPIGHYIYPHTMAEAHKWLNLANLDSYNLEVATFHQRACVCATHLKGFNEEQTDQRQKSGTDDPSRRSSVKSSENHGQWLSAHYPTGMNQNMSSSRSPSPSPRRQSGYNPQQQCWRSLCHFINSNRQQVGRICPETVSPEYCPNMQQQQQQQQSMCQTGSNESGTSQGMPCPQGGHYRLCHNPRCHGYSSCALCAQQREMMENNDQSQQTQEPVSLCSAQQQQQQQCAEGVYLTLNNTLGKQQQNRKCSNGLDPQPMLQRQQQKQQKQQPQQQQQQKRTSRSNSRSGQQPMQTKKPRSECCRACKVKDQGVQYDAKMVQPSPSLGRPASRPSFSTRANQPMDDGCGVPAKLQFSTASNNGIVYPTGPVVGKRSTPPAKCNNVIDMSAILGLQNEQSDRRPSSNTTPNTVNVLIMPGAPKESCEDDYICPENFQPSPLSEIRLLESDLTDGNERANFPDLDHPNYRLCRASTNDSETDCQGDDQDENCADVLLLDKSTGCGKCPSICVCDKTNENGNDCGQWNTEAMAQLQQNQSLAQLQQDQALPECTNWFDNPATSNSTRVLELQQARIKELYSLLTQQNELQKSIQDKMDELQHIDAEQGPSDTEAEQKPTRSGNATPNKRTQTNRRRSK